MNPSRTNPRMPARRSLVVALLLPLLGACTNPFLSNYVGERWPSVPAVELLDKPPAPETARWIGHSNFDSFDALTNQQAIAAARQVGADLVEWKDESLGEKVRWSSSPVLTNQWDGNMFNAPMANRQQEFRYEARFFRSKAIGGQAISGVNPAPPADAPKQPVPDHAAP